MSKEKLYQRYCAFIKRNNVPEEEQSYASWLESEVLIERSKRKQIRNIILAPIIEEFFSTECQERIKKYTLSDYEIVGMIIVEYRRVRSKNERLEKGVRKLTKALQVDMFFPARLDKSKREPPF